MHNLCTKSSLHLPFFLRTSMIPTYLRERERERDLDSTTKRMTITKHTVSKKMIPSRRNEVRFESPTPQIVEHK